MSDSIDGRRRFLKTALISAGAFAGALAARTVAYAQLSATIPWCGRWKIGPGTHRLPPMTRWRPPFVRRPPATPAAVAVVPGAARPPANPATNRAAGRRAGCMAGRGELSRDEPRQRHETDRRLRGTHIRACWLPGFCATTATICCCINALTANLSTAFYPQCRH